MMIARRDNPARPKRTMTMKLVSRFLKNESGATAIEYGLIASLVAVAAIAAMTTVGTKLTGMFNFVGTKLRTS
jgi:pilus assembly protein Flp/PilA